MVFRLQKQLEYRAMVVFQRVLRFYDNFMLLSALTVAVRLPPWSLTGALSFSEFHPSTTSLDKAAEGFLTSATCAAVVAVMLAIMLSFRFEGHVSATRLDLLIAWTPLVLLDWSIVGADTMVLGKE
ncbi:hypothetical protein BDZ45DRAFT_797919 [Acephala macrosclerotiorum]|nr:hypothetical protein BDZ45DRAFT_797919 [Acephala macrosclerotiorum]